MYVLALNGPPYSGKDSIANMIARREWQSDTVALPFSVAKPIRLAGFQLLGITYSDEKYAEIKDERRAALNGDTFRKWIIRFSEEFMKPTYGDDIFGLLAIGRLEELLFDHPTMNLLVAISDVGFPAEQERVVEFVGEDNYQLVHLYREGCDWSLDSRNYITLPGQVPLRLDNDATLDDAVDTLTSQMIRRGWSL